MKLGKVRQAVSVGPLKKIETKTERQTRKEEVGSDFVTSSSSSNSDTRKEFLDKMAMTVEKSQSALILDERQLKIQKF